MEMIEKIRELFIVRDDTFAIQLDDGTYNRVNEHLTDDIILKHLNREITIAVYQLDNNSLIKWVCFDFDKNKYDALKLFEYLKSHEKYKEGCAIEDTGGRGAHVWIFFNPPIPASVGKFLASEIVKNVGVECEIFPKQDDVSGGFGSCVRLPFGVHRKYGKKSILLEPLSLDEIKAINIPNSEIEEILESLKAEEEESKKVVTGLVPWWVECKAFDRIIRGDIDEGTRNECGFWIVRLFRNSGFPSWLTEAALDVWNQHLRKPLPNREISNIVKSVYKRGYSVGQLSLKKNDITKQYCEGCVKPVCSPKRKIEKNEKTKLIKPYGVF
jgi:hypothetical protein